MCEKPRICKSLNYIKGKHSYKKPLQMAKMIAAKSKLIHCMGEKFLAVMPRAFACWALLLSMQCM